MGTSQAVEDSNVSVSDGHSSSATLQNFPGTELTDGEDATEEQIQNLRHIIDDIPVTVWLVALTGAAQGFAYFGITVTWQNYLQNPPGNPLLPGALGLGQSLATTINNAFLFFGCLTPTLLAVVSDAWLGRYKTLIVSLGLFFIGCVVLLGTSLPTAQALPNVSLAGLVVAFVFIGLGQGGVRTVVHPLLGDQLPMRKPKVVRTKDGELVVTDRTMTIQYIFNVFYWMINVAGLSLLATTSLEKQVGFWAAYLLPICVLVTGIVPLLVWNGRLGRSESFGFGASVLMHRNRVVPWSEGFVSEVRQALGASKVMLCFIVFWLCYGQVGNNMVSQAGQMNTGDISNDTIQALNPIACILLGPLIQKVLFAGLARHRISFGPIARMTVAFGFMALGIAYSAITQKLIYNRGPCFDHPLACPAALTSGIGNEAGHGSGLDPRPNDISVWVQVPFYILIAVGEILGFVTLNEFAYAQAPKSMKALLQSFQSLTAGLGSALGMALGPVSKDPWLVIFYATLAGATAVSGGMFWAVFRKYDCQEATTSSNAESMNSDDVEKVNAASKVDK